VLKYSSYAQAQMWTFSAQKLLPALGLAQAGLAANLKHSPV